RPGRRDRGTARVPRGRRAALPDMSPPAASPGPNTDRCRPRRAARPAGASGRSWSSGRSRCRCGAGAAGVRRSSGSGPGRAFQLHRVAFRVLKVDRRALAFRAVAGLDRAGVEAVLFQVRDDGVRVIRFDAEAEMVEVAGFLPGRGAALAAERAVDGDEVDEAGAGAELVQAEVFLHFLDGAADDLGVEMQH